MRAHALRHRSTFVSRSLAAGLVAALGVAGAALGATPVGDEFQVNTYTTNAQQVPSIAADADGAFVVAWQSLGSAGSDSSGFSIQGQRYAGPPPAAPPAVIPALSPSRLMGLVAVLLGAGALSLRGRRRLLS